MAIPDPGRIPRLLGLATWAVVGVPVGIYLNAEAPTPERTFSAVGAYLVFGLAFYVLTSLRGHGRPLAVSLLALQTVAALVLCASARTGFEGISLVLVAAQAGSIFAVHGAASWCAAQTALYAAILLTRLPIPSAIVSAAAFAGFQGFALWAAHVAAREGRQREELQLLYAELKSTQELLAEGSRLSERTRIARDLHDVLGHHLTALSLALEVASHVSEGRAREEVERARSLARLLLADVRGVVSELRGGEAVDLAPAFRALAERIPRPEVAVEIGEGVEVRDPALAETLLRAAQEIVTNAVRHSGAARLDLALRREDGRLRLSGHDDGRGAADLREGHGLTGLRERVAAAGGEVRFESAPGRGFLVTLSLPEREPGT